MSELSDDNGCDCRFCVRSRSFRKAMEGADDPVFLWTVFERFQEMEYDYDRIKLRLEARDAD